MTLRGDFYPITPYTKANDAFCCTQFDIPEEGKGFAHMLALPQCDQKRFAPHLYVHAPDRVHRFENPFTGEQRRITGRELQEKGFDLAMERRSGAIWFYTVEVYETC